MQDLAAVPFGSENADRVVAGLTLAFNALLGNGETIFDLGAQNYGFAAAGYENNLTAFVAGWLAAFAERETPALIPTSLSDDRVLLTRRKRQRHMLLMAGIMVLRCTVPVTEQAYESYLIRLTRMSKRITYDTLNRPIINLGEEMFTWMNRNRLSPEAARGFWGLTLEMLDGELFGADASAVRALLEEKMYLLPFNQTAIRAALP